MADETAVVVVVEAGDHTIINKRFGNNPFQNRHGPILIGLHNGPFFPYPIVGNLQQLVTPNCQPNILGQKPQQAHIASAQPSYTPTYLHVAIHTLSMASPDEQ